jgi:hypothetical protein
MTETGTQGCGDRSIDIVAAHPVGAKTYGRNGRVTGMDGLHELFLID